MRVIYFEHIENKEVLETEEQVFGLWSCDESFLPRVDDIVWFHATGNENLDPFIATARRNNYPGKYKVLYIHHSYNQYHGIQECKYYAEVHVKRIN